MRLRRSSPPVDDADSGSIPSQTRSEGKHRRGREAAGPAPAPAPACAPDGWQPLEKSLSALVADGTVELEQARLVSLSPKDVESPVATPVVEAAGRFGRRR